MKGRLRLRALVVKVLMLAAVVSLRLPVQAQSDPDVAIRFFQEGGAYCVRIAPEGVSLSDETAWTFMLLTSASNPRNTFRVRTIDPGDTRLAGQTLTDVGMAITNVWRRESLRDEFFQRFAAGIDRNLLRARTVRMSPRRLEEMKPGQRAELYLKFADRGSKVDFGRMSDLKPDEFLALQTYLQD